MADKPTDIIGVVGDTLGVINSGFDLAENLYGATESVTELGRNAGLPLPDAGVAGATVVGTLFAGIPGGILANTLAQQGAHHGSHDGDPSGNADGGTTAGTHGRTPGPRGGTAPTVTVDPSVKEPIVAYCQAQSEAMERITAHLNTYCTLNGSFGLLLGVFMRPRYEQSRDRAFEAFGHVRATVDALTTQLQAAMTDMEQHEQSVQQQLDEVLKQLEELRNAGTTGGTGGGTGGYGGGGYGGGGYAPSPQLPSDLGSTEPDPHVSVSVHVGADGQVDVDVDVDGNAADVDIDVDVDAKDDSTANSPSDASGDPTGETPPATGIGVPTGAAGSGGASGGPGTAGGTGSDDDANALGVHTIEGTLPENLTGTEDLTAEQLAQRSTFYDQIWQEQAAHDPLGRTAEQLRLAWERREPLTLDESLIVGATTLGYGNTSAVADIAADLSLIPAANGAAS